MSHSKYPENIRFYRDLFVGEVYSFENQKILNTLSQRLKDKILQCLAKEEEIIRSKTILDANDHDGIYLKYAYHKSCLSQSLSQVHPASYLLGLSDIDRQNIYNLLYCILYDDDHGIFRNYINKVTIVGSTTYPENYRDDLSHYKITDETQQRIINKGNDIDIQLSSSIKGNCNGLKDLIHTLLKKYNIQYVFNDSKKDDGTSYLKIPKKYQDGDPELHEYKVTNYGCPNFILKYSQGRSIHLVLVQEFGDSIVKREYLEGRTHSVLFDGANERHICKKIFENILNGSEIYIPHTFEDIYAQLLQNKRINYQNKCEAKNYQRQLNQKSRNEINF